jgi:hypothetical protein
MTSEENSAHIETPSDAHMAEIIDRMTRWFESQYFPPAPDMVRQQYAAIHREVTGGA